jgi:hypothetical protein
MPRKWSNDQLKAAVDLSESPLNLTGPETFC